MTKVKKEKVAADGEEAAAADGNEKTYQELIANVNPISQPLASKKLSKKLYKCVKKGKKYRIYSREFNWAADMRWSLPLPSGFSSRLPNSIENVMSFLIFCVSA